MNKYQLIYADPAWSWIARSPKGEGRSAKQHYQVMDLQAIKDLPVASISEGRSTLCMWAIDPMLPQALEVMAAWGFEYKTVVFYWVKENKRSSGFFMGGGYYTRANPEICILGSRKKFSIGPLRIRGGGLARVRKDIRRLIVSPVGRHSEKPEEARIRLEQLFGDVSRVELFARSRRPGWDAWGNQVEGSIQLEGDNQ